MSYLTDAGVDVYIEALPGWQREICRQVRDFVHAADADVEETTKRKGQPYFVLQGNICALLAARDHVNVFLYDGGIVCNEAPRPAVAHSATSAGVGRLSFRPGQRLLRLGQVGALD